MDYTKTDWLRQSIWDPLKEDVMLVHGYAGGDDELPMVVLRDGKVFLISSYIHILKVYNFTILSLY